VFSVPFSPSHLPQQSSLPRLAVPVLSSCSSRQLTTVDGGKMYQAAALEGDAIWCFFSWGHVRSPEKRWVKEIAVSASALCPQIPPVALFGAGVTVSKWPLCSQIRAIGTEPPWPWNPYLAATYGARVDHTCFQLGQGDDGIACA